MVACHQILRVWSMNTMILWVRCHGSLDMVHGCHLIELRAYWENEKELEKIARLRSLQSLQMTNRNVAWTHC